MQLDAVSVWPMPARVSAVHSTSEAALSDAPHSGLDVSVVIPTYRRPELLERCLMAAAHQTFFAWRYEIIVCDDAADEATRAQVEHFAALQQRRGLRVVYVAVEGTRGPAGARNCGWRCSTAS